MRLLICTGIYPPEIGGPATYSKLIGEKLRQRGHNVRILTYGTAQTINPKSEILNKFKIQNSKFKINYVSRGLPAGLRHFFYFLQVLKLGRDVDMIYMQDSVSVGLPATLANIFLKKKLILKVVGDYAWEQASQISNFKFQISNLDNFYPFDNEKYPVKIQILEKIQNWVARKADKIITPSFYLKNILENGWKINSEKIKVIYNSFNIKESGIRNKELGNKFKMLSVGRLVPWKGFDTLIEVVRDIPNVELEIIGDGPLLENIKFQISNFKLLG
ncbi:glycosyltransferase family 4 protein [Candidatus Parcubacteria bacterium]|nr:glycosyltransferase family 4 protein [Candidatus Parcubacteria bacterium]